MKETDAQLPSPKGLRLPKEKCACIIEPRKHPHLSYVIRNVMHFLDDSWGLCIVHGTENRAFVEEIIEGWGEVLLINCGKENLLYEDYVDFKCDPSFWQQIPSETILMFETDAIMLRSGIDEFLEYDWVGAPWIHSRRHEKLVGALVGNGGFSLRKKSAVLKILKEHPHPPGTSSDMYYSKWMHADGYHVPPVRIAKKFSVEGLYFPKALAFHKAWLYNSAWDFDYLLDQVEYSH